MNDSSKQGLSLTVSLHGKEMLFSITKPSQEKSTNLIIDIERDTVTPDWVSEVLKPLDDATPLSSVEILIDPAMDLGELCDHEFIMGCQCDNTIIEKWENIACDIVLYAAPTVEELTLSIDFLTALLKRLPSKIPGARPKAGEKIPFANMTSICFKHIPSDFTARREDLLKLVKYWRLARDDSEKIKINLEPLVIMYPSQRTRNAKTNLNNVLDKYYCRAKILTAAALEE